MTELRAGRSTDAGAVGAILSEFTATTDWMPHLHTQAEDIAHAGALLDRGWVTVATQDRDVVGFSACNGSDLNALYVSSNARGQGIGSTLLKHLQQDQPVLMLWTFQANTRAQKFYQRHGFIETQRTDGATTDEGLPDVQYKWQRENG